MTSRLYTTQYIEPNPARAQELASCLQANEGVFDIVRAPCEGGGSPRQRYRDMLDYAAGEAGPDDIVVLANCDIIIQADALKLIGESLRAGEMYALSRWEGPAPHNCEWSQDVWAFRGPPKVAGGDYFFGVPGCDNRFAHDADASGYRVLNPSKSIVTVHVHQSRIRTATNSIAFRIDPPYLLIKPHCLGEQAQRRRIGDNGQFRDALPLHRRREVANA
jgi:hypothetical protein